MIQENTMYRRARVIFILLVITWLTGNISAQEITIGGIVKDMNTYQELRGVNVYIKGTTIGTSTDYTGKFYLKIQNPSSEMVVVFQHIAYEITEIPLDSLRNVKNIYLQPRVIPLQGVEIEERGLRHMEIEKDLPQIVSIMEARNFEIRGYVDAGDLLRNDHSIQLEEELSGKKTVSIRGGNPDEVVVLYNGVKLNNSYDNIFDLSLIDLEDIDRFEIIKGSNTVLYGPEAFSGVINIVPKMQQDYTVRVQQRLGTYRSGNFGLHLYRKFGKFHGSYSYKRGGFQRTFVDLPEDQGLLKNSSLHHTANLNYSFKENPDGSPANSLGFMWIYTSLDYTNQRDVESLNNFNQLFSTKYTGDIASIKDVDLSVSYKRLEEEQFLASGIGSLNRDIEDRSFFVEVEKRFSLGQNDFLISYQYQNARLDLLDRRVNFEEQPLGLESSLITRQHHGLVGIAKIHGETDSEFMQTLDFDVSVRYDRVRDDQNKSTVRGTLESSALPPGIFNNNDWDETTVKFSVNMTGFKNDLHIKSFLNFGSNVKFPTLFQQVSSPLILTNRANQPNLNPEKNSSIEIGTIITKNIRNHPSLYGWQFTGTYFVNNYDNKFRLFTTPGIPIAFYDNVQDARISGFESKFNLFLFRKKVTVDVGLSRYDISDRSAFPFRSEIKRTVNFNIDHAGYAFQLHWFKEGEQVGWIRSLKGEFSQVILPDYMNLDLHISKTFEIGKFKFFANFSGRNLLNDNDVVLQGLSIRDRRFYVTFGAQY